MSGFIGLQSYTEFDNLVISQLAGDNSFVGRVYSMAPLTGGGTEFSNLISSILKSAPDESVMQFSLICSPDSNVESNFSMGKLTQNIVLNELIAAQGSLFDRGLSYGQIPALPAINKLRLIISFNIPVKSLSNEAVQDSVWIQKEFLNGLTVCGFGEVLVLKPEEIIGVYKQFSNIFTDPKPVLLDPNLPLNHQVFTSEDVMDFRSDKYMHMTDGVIGRVVSVKTLPEVVQDGLMNLIIGAPLGSGSVREGGGHRIGTPYIISTSVRLARQQVESQRIQRSISSRQNINNLPKWLNFGAPKESVIEDLKWMEQTSSDGVNKYVFVNLTCFLFATELSQLDEASSNMKTTLNNLGFDARDVLINHGVRWANALPLNFSPSIAKKLDNEALMPATSAACLLPIYGDYCGNAVLKAGMDPINSKSGSVFLTRRGRAFYFDPFVSNTNKNGIIFAESGAGKSFVMQYMIANHLAEGATVFLFDNGKSAKKTCLALGGEFIEFAIEHGRESSINPFSGLTSMEFNEQSENICDLLIKMCYFQETIQAGAKIVMNEAVKSAFAQKQEDTEIENVVEALSNIVENYESKEFLEPESIQAARNLKVRLNAFIKSPTRGPFFKGQSNLNPKSAFTVIELSSLDGDLHLKQCVLFFVMNTIMNRIKSREGRKLIFLDEAWQLLKDETAASAVAGFFRKIRKDNGSIWVITQSLDDLSGNACGEVILGQSQWKLIMKQKPEVIDKNLKSGAISRFASDPYFVKSLKDIESSRGKYSEILIVGDKIYESVRLYVPEFTGALFSSEGAERDTVFNLMNDGMSTVDAVRLVIANQKDDRDRWLDAIVYKLSQDEKNNEVQFVEEFKAAFARSKKRTQKILD